ncbi:MAG TPA: 5-bromo-4-chloroindolyl phosphate hydrolysis family protein [Enterococcus sp.]|nr:5-bromo-4-chloroindolyl phosphate hydrolysis family protein [Enterococcus sp.]HPR80353.1 5-bromo-4-chloroindolyl phosphate hydrolysis family protein [Enterococcus sp.]
MKRSTWTVIGLVTIGAIVFGTMLSDYFPVLLLIGGVLLVVYGFKGKSAPVSNNSLPVLSKKREQTYLDSGMSYREIEFFRETLNQTKTEIEKLQTNISQNAKLKAIDLRHDTIRAAKALFKELVKEPTRLNEASHFLYTHLPNMVDLTVKYLEINNHEIKSRDTYEKMEESIQIIDQMASLIKQDYQKFVSDDLEELDVELSIAKQSIKRENQYKEEVR